MRFQSNYEQRIAQKLTLRPQQVGAAIQLLDGGNTIPFIARYRKELTDSLDEDQLRRLHDLLDSLRRVDERRDSILNSIEEQGALSPALEAQLIAAETLTELEDLYLPYKPKRRTRASIARERGLSPLAALMLAQGREKPDSAAQAFLNADVPTIEDALAGARDIVAEQISDHAAIRGQLRQKALKFGTLHASKIADATDDKGVYQLYYDYSNRIERLQPHQILAINRGEQEKILRVRVEVPERDWNAAVQQQFPLRHQSPWREQLQRAMEDAAKRLLLPAIERDVRSTLTETAEVHAIQVFAQNMRGLLTQPPLLNRVILGIDPAYRTGCKLAVVDETGKLLHTDTLYPHEPQRRRHEALASLQQLVERFRITLIAIGNGTASRETEQLVAELTRKLPDVHYLIVNEAGASVYSASPLARQEFPDLDVSLRGAVSIARRAQDPLAELVKIDPRSVGVGLYQHDVNQKALSAALDGVVESVVNQVGVDVNTASSALLTHVAGIGPKLAERIVAYRDEQGAFQERRQLLKVSGLGAKAYEQAAGFLRIREGKNPLDASAIHPESYPSAEALLKLARLSPHSPLEDRAAPLNALRQQKAPETLAAELGIGPPTLADIFEQLLRPGRDPREDMPAPILRSDVLSMDDLRPGMQLKGTVRNVVDFGSFIDIGVKQDGLLHRSQLPRGQQLAVGDVVDVEILAIDPERGRISLAWGGG